MSIVDEFKEFILRGNVLDLAVAFVMGAAFNAVVTALVTDLVTPLIGIPGHVDFATITYTINGSTFLLGAFVNSVIAFIALAIAVFFFIVKPANKLRDRMAAKNKPAEPNMKKCPYCFMDIPIKATRCGYCTSKLKE